MVSASLCAGARRRSWTLVAAVTFLVSCSSDALGSADHIEAVALDVATADPASGNDSLSRAGQPGTTVALRVMIDQGRVLAVDTEHSEIAELSDDRGTDLLAAGQRIEEARRQGPSPGHVSVSFGGGIANGMELMGVTDDGAGVVTLRSLALPSTGAVSLRARGRLVVTAGRNVVTEDLPNVELKQGTVVNLGNLKATLRSAGSTESWSLASNESLDAIADVQAIGPDGNPGGTFAAGNTRGFFTTPGVARVTLRVKRYRDVARQELPFDLSVGLGIGGDTQTAPAAAGKAVTTTSSAEGMEPVELEVAAVEPSSGDALSPTRRPGTTVVLLVTSGHEHLIALDAAHSAMTELADDRGTDLLAAGRRIEEAKKQGLPGGSVRIGRGAESIKLTRVTADGAGVVTLSSLALPAKGATALRIGGRLAATVGKVITEDLKDVELKAGTVVKIGEVKATLRSSGSMGSSRSWSFDPPLEGVADIQAIGPGERTFGGGTSKGFFAAPDATRVTLRVKRHRDVTPRELPFNLTVGLGFGGHTQSAAAAPTTGPSVTAPACVNPYYFPAPDGARWTYEETDSMQSLAHVGEGEMPASQGTSTVIRRPTSEAGFSEQTRLRGDGSESSSSLEWICTAEGLRAQSNLGMVAMMIPTEGLGPWNDVGVDVPPAPAWQVGAKWRHVAEASGGQEAKATVRKLVVSISYEIVGRERVTVPAGTYEAFKVEGTATIDAEGDKLHGSVLTTKTTAWYAQDVGLVQSRTLSTLRSSGSAEPDSGTGGMQMQRTTALKNFTTGASH